MRNHVKEEPSELVIEKAGSDLALVHACKGGDVSAFEELVKRYDFRLLRIACHITQNREDAEEAVQDAFLKAYMKLDQFEEKASFSTWVTRIVVNESLQRLRKQRVTKASVSLTREDEDVPLDIADWAPNPEQHYSAMELRGVLLKSLAALSPGLRVVFVLRDMAGLSGDETAEVLKLGLSAVKARLLRARLQLREKLTRHFRGPVMAKGLRDESTGQLRPDGATAIMESYFSLAIDTDMIMNPLASKGDEGDRTREALNELLTQH